MINSNATPTPILEQNPGQPKTVRRTSRSVDRKPPKDPMKLFPYLFQFTSPRLTEAEKLAPTSDDGRPDQRCAQPLFLSLRSPSDQMWIVAVPSRRIGERDLTD
jgi:hypothetical protein